MFKPEYLSRQSDLLPAEKLGVPITIIGAGAIGSHLTMALARMGFFNITVWDYDEVDVANMNCQGYKHGDIGRQKVGANGLEIKFKNKMWKFNDSSELKGIVIAAADCMETRKQMFKAASDELSNALLFIDTRMGAESGTLYVVEKTNQKAIEAYTKTLYSNEEAVREPCTAKATVYTAYLMAGLAAKAVKDYVTEQPYTKTVLWNIKNNAYVSWNSDVAQ